eukprot:c26914_g1_i1 orf=573-2312(-)
MSEKEHGGRPPAGRRFSMWNVRHASSFEYAGSSGRSGAAVDKFENEWERREERMDAIACVSGQSESGRGASGVSDKGWNHRLRDGQNSKGYGRLRRGSDEHRYWFYSTTEPLRFADRFVILSYNILGVESVNLHRRELYSRIPAFILNWEHRKQRILLEFDLWLPDVLCLQEVDRFDELQEDLGQRGFKGVFKARTGAVRDGCAIFWREERFSLLQEESIEFKKLDLRDNIAQLCVLQSKHGKWTTSITGERTVKRNKSENRVIVCNIHVLFNPNRGDIKIGQVRVLLKKAYALSKEWGRIPVIVAGDFNSTPQSALYQFMQSSKLDVSCFDRRKMSGVLEGFYPLSISRGPMVSTVGDRWGSPTQPYSGHNYEVKSSDLFGSVKLRHETSDYDKSLASGGCMETYGTGAAQWNAQLTLCLEQQSIGVTSNMNSPLRSYQWGFEELKAATGHSKSSIAKHRFKLRSCYSSIVGPIENRDTVGEPLATTYHGKFMGTVDYIWYSEGLYPIRVLDFMPFHVLQRTGGLPSRKWGSDHLAVACEFAFLTSSKDKLNTHIRYEDSSDSLGEEELADYTESEEG